MLTVATYLWDGEPAARGTVYGPEHVHALRRQCARFLPPHRFAVLADRDVDGVETIRIPGGRKRYPKLHLWRSDPGLTGRVLALDLDTVILADMAPLIDRPEPVVLWRDPTSRGKRSATYNTSMILLTMGAHPEVWDRFRPAAASRVRGSGSDQAWVTHVLGPKVPTWCKEDGVLSYKRDCRSGVPEGARVVFFHGTPKPWDLPAWEKLR